MSLGIGEAPRVARLGQLLRRERGLTALLAMAVAGIAIAAYLTSVHYLDVPLVCPANTLINCAQVTSSAYSVVPGTQIPITIPGMLWFIVSGALAVLALVRSAQERPEPERLRLYHMLWGAVGLLFVLYLVYAEIVLLHRLCEWCTVIHLLTLATFLVALSRWQQGPAPAIAPRGERPAPARTPASSVHASHAPATQAHTRRPVATSTSSKARGKRR
ncbi:MAG TPA: vitamin K epoxide reductase family protein [Ktedonobacterales bacterium]|nr:vitamin K epoxide reductase family protein [Ktedonobacterales bacterium]